jgi:hypothetical protein
MNLNVCDLSEDDSYEKGRKGSKEVQGKSRVKVWFWLESLLSLILKGALENE